MEGYEEAVKMSERRIKEFERWFDEMAEWREEKKKRNDTMMPAKP